MERERGGREFLGILNFWKDVLAFSVRNPSPSLSRFDYALCAGGSCVLFLFLFLCFLGSSLPIFLALVQTFSILGRGVLASLVPFSVDRAVFADVVDVEWFALLRKAPPRSLYLFPSSNEIHIYGHIPYFSVFRRRKDGRQKRENGDKMWMSGC